MVYRDHLKDKHDLSKDLLNQINFKGGPLRSMKTLEMKWKHAYLTLFPEVPKDQVPSPFRYNYFDENSPLHAHNHCSGCTCEAKKSTQRPLDFSSFITTAQNGLYDYLSSNKLLSCSTKMDILMGFGDFCNKINTSSTGEANQDAPTIDWKHLSQRGATPDFEFTDDQSPVNISEELDPSFENPDSEAQIDEPTFHGLPNSPILSAFQQSQFAHNYGGSMASQDYFPELNSSANKDCTGYSDSMAPPLALHTSDAKNQTSDYGGQVHTPPFTPNELDCSLDAKPAIASSDDHNDAVLKAETIMTPKIDSQSWDSASNGLESKFCAGATADWQLYDTYTNIDDLAPAIWPGDTCGEGSAAPHVAA